MVQHSSKQYRPFSREHGKVDDNVKISFGKGMNYLGQDVDQLFFTINIGGLFF